LRPQNRGMKSKTSLLTTALWALVLCAPAANASTTFDLDISNGCCGAGPYGTVQLSQNGSNEVDFLVNLNNGFDFIWGGQAGAFGFNLTVGGTPVVMVSPASVTAGFSSTVLGSTASQSEHMDGFGSFNFAITGDANHTNGASQPIGQMLSFSVTDGSGISISNFLHDSTGGSIASYFSADIFCTGCRSSATGIVGTDDISTTGAVPEPSTFLISGLGLVGLGLLRKRASN
jgi:hypothetical protein